MRDVPEQSDYDIGRTYEIKSFGLKLIRFTNNQVETHLEEVIREIMNRCWKQVPFRELGTRQLVFITYFLTNNFLCKNSSTA